MAAKIPQKRGTYALRLYVAEHTPRSILALSNLRTLCEEHLAGRYSLEVVDLMKNPELAKIDRILAVPTLIRKLPIPIRKFIGNLSDPERLLIDLDLLPADAAPVVT